MNFRIIATFVIFLFGMRVNGQTVTPSEPLSKSLTIFDLPPLKEQSVVSSTMRDYIEKKTILTLDMDIDCDPEKGIHPR